MGVIIPVEQDNAQFLSAMQEMQAAVERSGNSIAKALEDMSARGAKATRELTDAEKAAAKAAKELADAEKAAAKAAKEAEEKTKNAAKGMEELADAGGLPVDMFRKLSEGFKAATSTMTPAQLGMVSFGGAAVAAAAAATLSVAAVVKLGEGIVSLVQSSAKAIPSLQELGKASGVTLVSQETVSRVQRADAAITSVGISASALGAVIAGQLGPGVTNLSTLLVASNLALADFFAANDKIIGVVVQLGSAIVDYMMAPIKGAILLLGTFLGGIVDMAQALGSDMADSLEGVANSMLLFGASDFEDNLKSMTNAVGDYIPEAEALITAQVGAAEAAKRKAEAEAEAKKKQDAATAAYKSSTDALVRLAEAQKLASVEGMARVDAEHAANKAEIDGLFAVADKNAKNAEDKQKAADEYKAALEAETAAYLAAVAKQTAADDKKAADAEKAAAEEEKRKQDAAKAQAKQVQGIQAIATAELNRHAKGRALLAAQHQQALANIEDLRQEAVEAATTEEQRVAANEAANAAIAASNSGYHQDLQAMAKAAVKNIAAGAAHAAQAAAGVAKKAMSAIGFNFQSIMSAASGADGPKAAIKEMADQAKQFIAALPDAIKAFTAELPGVIRSLVDGIPDVVDALVDALPKIVGALVAALPDLFDAIKSSIPKLFKTVADLLPVLIIGIVKELPGLVTVLAKQIPILVDALLAALPDIIMAILDALPLIIISLVKMIPVLIVTIIKNLPTIIKALVAGIFKMTFVMTKLLVKFAFDIIGTAVGKVVDKVKGYFTALKEAVQKFFQRYIDTLKEIFTLGKANTKTYGDSPGVVRAGPQGMNVRASPGDYALIGRDRQALLERAMAANGARPAPAMSAGPMLVLNDHVRQFDRLGYRLALTGGIQTDVSNRPPLKNARGR